MSRTNTTTTFEYLGFTFRPVRTFTREERHAAETGRGNFWNTLEDGESFFHYGNGYQWEDFYEAATPAGRNCDIFYCDETETTYIPASRCLFKFIA